MPGHWAHMAWSSSVLAAAATLLVACASAPAGAGAGSASAPSESGAPADAPDSVPPGCLLLVRGLSAPTMDQTAGVYTGAFLVLRIGEDGRVRGEGGDFHSEGYDVRGEIGPMGPQLEMNAPTEPTDWQPLPLVWVAERETFEGWDRVRLGDLREYSGGGVPSARSDCGEGDVR